MTVTDDKRNRVSPRLGLGHVEVPDKKRPTQLYARQKVSAGQAVFVALVGLLVLLALQLTWTRGTVERSIESRVGNAVTRAGFVAVTADAHGRDITLEGKTATLNEAYQATRIARDQEGVRSVDSAIVVDSSVITAAEAKARADAEAAGVEVPAAQPTELPAFPTVTVTVGDGKIRLAGVIGDQATADKLLGAAARAFPDQVTDELLIDQEAGSTGAIGLVQGLATMDASASGTYRLQLGTVTYSGTVDSVAVHDNMLARSRSALKDQTKVIDNLVVVTGGADEELVQRLTSLPSIAFGEGASLSATGRATVQDIAAALKSQSSFTVKIQGFVDTERSASNDRSLSQDRADAVRSELEKQGIPASRLVAEGLGDTKPLIVDPKTDVDRAINTRIAIVVDET